MLNAKPFARTNLVSALAALFALGACSGSSSEPAAAPAVPTNVPLERGASEAPEQQQFAYFAGGCFWGVEHFLEQMDGVFEVESGYMGGTKDNPTYEDVLTHATGHLETVRVRFDPAKVSYKELAKRFFEIHDPTQRDGQGPDIGNQYLSAVFYVDDDQKRDTDALIGLLKERGYDVATTVRPADDFWKAEGYHQDYYARTGKTPYCHARVRRFDD
jgi:methionine-S-sulfoxide reductase